jgi:predicted RNase H-like HicB family nuclease
MRIMKCIDNLTLEGHHQCVSIEPTHQSRNMVSQGAFMKFNIILEPAEEGGFNVSVPALEGCYTQGDSETEAIVNAKEAILCYLEGLEKVNQIRSTPQATVKEVEVLI